MAELAGPYCERNELKRRMQIPDSDNTRDAELDDARASASDTINRFCSRVFGRAEVATARTFYGRSSGVDTDDFWTADDLLINGVPWALGQAYALEPLNGVVDGVPGWPTNRLATPWMTHPIYWGGNGVAVEVTAKWGWETVPASVKDACLILAADDLKSGDAPFGVAGFGDYVTRVRSNPRAAEKLKAYVREILKAA